MAQPLLSPKLGAQGVPSLWTEYSFLLLNLDYCWQDNGRALPRLVSCRTVCDHWQSTLIYHGGSAVQWQGAGAPKWSVAVHWVIRLWDFLDDAGQGQPPPVFCPGPLCMSYKAIRDGCYLYWAWRFPGEAQLWIRLEPVSKRYRG